MLINLTRYGSTPAGTFGELHVEDLKLYTIERPWQNNQPFTSCIPAGDYFLEPYRSSKYGACWVVVNPDLDVYRADQGRGRYAILIHAANRARELAGCIAPGEALGTVSGEWAVERSRGAMDALQQVLGGREQHELLIRWAMPQAAGIYQY